FPHTLRVYIRLERPVALLRQGPSAWVVSARGRVLRTVQRPYPRLPRLWARSDVSVAVDATLTGPEREASAALGAAARSRLAGHVQTVLPLAGALTLVLRSGLRVVL